MLNHRLQKLCTVYTLVSLLRPDDLSGRAAAAPSEQRAPDRPAANQRDKAERRKPVYAQSLPLALGSKQLAADEGT